MKLEKLNAVIRPRSNSEAVDLGFRLAAHYFFNCLLPILTITLPLAIVLFWALKSFSPTWMFLALWWLKPAWESISLIIISQAIFSQTPSYKATLKQWLKQPWWEIIAYLSWRRLSISRNFDYAVSHLEQLKGSQRRQRLIALHNENISATFAIGILGFIVETVFVFAIVYCSFRLFEFQYLQENNPLSPYAKHLSFFSYAIAQSIISPFFISTGFSLYLNRRTLLEGWDIELQFKRLSSRLLNINRETAAIVLCCTLLMPFAIISPIAKAEQRSESQAAQHLILESISGEEFYQQEKAKTLVRKIPKQADIEENNFLKKIIDSIMDWLFAHQKNSTDRAATLLSIAQWLRAIAWTILALLVIYLIWRYHDYFLLWRAKANKIQTKKMQPTELFGMDIRASTLPDDIPTTAQLMWQQGQYRDALGLLYRGALSVCVNNFDLPFRNYHTEGECLTIIEQQQPTLHAYFEKLTRFWQSAAYGHLTPLLNFEEFCQQWQNHFAREAKANAEN